MSHPSKIQLLKDARECGYRTYLYYIATADPDINISRIAERVVAGGHDVPEEKVRARYYRSLELLPEAIQASHRAYIFDNSRSGTERTLIAELEGGSRMKLQLDHADTPIWFRKHVIMKLSPDD
jgi:predicted ABC-type ATPase